MHYFRKKGVSIHDLLPIIDEHIYHVTLLSHCGIIDTNNYLLYTPTLDPQVVHKMSRT